MSLSISPHTSLRSQAAALLERQERLQKAREAARLADEEEARIAGRKVPHRTAALPRIGEFKANRYKPASQKQQQHKPPPQQQLRGHAAVPLVQAAAAVTQRPGVLQWGAPYCCCAAARHVWARPRPL